MLYTINIYSIGNKLPTWIFRGQTEIDLVWIITNQVRHGIANDFTKIEIIKEEKENDQ